MNRYKLILFLAVWCLVLGFTAIAQQPAANKRSPVLTSEDLTRARNQSGSTIVVSAVEPSEWVKFSPGDLQLSLEIPGGLDPVEVPLNEYLLNELHREYGDAKSYVANTNFLEVYMLYLPGKKALSASAADLKGTATRFMKLISLALDRNAVFSAELAGKSKVSVKGNYTIGSETYELLGTMQSKGKETWLVTSVFRHSDETARKIARRVVGSAALN